MSQQRVAAFEMRHGEIILVWRSVLQKAEHVFHSTVAAAAFTCKYSACQVTNRRLICKDITAHVDCHNGYSWRKNVPSKGAINKPKDMQRNAQASEQVFSGTSQGRGVSLVPGGYVGILTVPR